MKHSIGRSADPPDRARGELVLGVPRADLLPGGNWRGVLAGDAAAYLDTVARLATFRPRVEVEDDPTWKQVIPYLVLRDGKRFFLMRRTRAGADARLHDRYSIGIGGHVNPEDGDVYGGLRREWREEVDAAFEPEFRLVGLLNDDDDPVGAVHFGIVFVADAAGRAVAVRETQKLEGAFVDPVRVREVMAGLETWSRFVFEHLEITGGPGR